MRTRIRIMEIPVDQSDRLEALQGLIGRLSAPDLTLAEAKSLRERLSALLESEDRPGRPHPTNPTHSHDRGQGPHIEIGSPGRSMRVAG